MILANNWLRVLLFFWLFPAFFYAQSYALPGGVELQGSTTLEYAAADTAASRFFENWTDLNFSKNGFRAGLRFEAHGPQATFAEQYDFAGLTHRFLEYRKGGFFARVGNFHTLFGKGLMLRSFENRTLRWDNNIDGAKVELKRDYFDAQAIYGKPRKARVSVQDTVESGTPAAGIRGSAIFGGEVKLKPVNKFHFGGSFLSSEKEAVTNTRGTNRMSGFGELNLDQGSLYGEYIFVDEQDGESSANGIYLSANLFLGSLSLLGEYRDYDQIGLQQGLLNNPPTVFQEHLYTLLNRQQLIQNADNEQGFLVQASLPVSENGIFTSNYSRTTNQIGGEIYEDAYAQFELDEFLDSEWVWAVGRQEDLIGRYLNFVASGSHDFGNYKSIKVTYEHQHGKLNATDAQTEEQHYDQLFTTEFGLTSALAFSVLAEHSTFQFAKTESNLASGELPAQKHHYWLGGQLNITLWDRAELAVFGGQRRKGKVCIGGVCVVKPELEGLEVTLTARL